MSIPISQFIPTSLPPWYPYICSLCLCLYFCFANKFICIIFLDSTYMQYYTIFVFLTRWFFKMLILLIHFPEWYCQCLPMLSPQSCGYGLQDSCFIQPSLHSSLISCHVPLTFLSPSFKHGGQATPSIQDALLSLLQLPTLQIFHFSDQSSHPWGSIFSSPWLVQIYY